MREIKFRVWNHTYTPNGSSGIGEMVYDIEVRNTIWNNEIISVNNIIKNKPRVMQFTGLFDKQGVEIYEGDIVKVENYNHHGENPKKVMFVYYDNLTAQYCTKIEKTNFKIEDLIMENQPLCFAHSIEIIGNIYENRELLTHQNRS